MIICSDLDGTLLTSHNAVAAPTAAALRRAEANGHAVVLASSRPPRSVEQIARQLGLISSIRISLNGSFVFSGDEVVASVAIAEDDFAQAERIVAALDLHLSAYSGWTWWSLRRDAALAAEERIVGFAADFAGQSAGRPVSPNKLMVVGAPERILEFQARVAGVLPAVAATLSKPDYCEIVARGVSKASGLAIVCSRLHCEATQVIAFGDAENDRELIRFAGTGVAMGNAAASLKSVADIVTLDNDHGGVEAVLERLGLA